jgi:hypothetical protein
MRNRGIAVAVILLCTLMHVCSAQEEMSPAEKKQQTLVTEPLTLYKGFFRAQVSTYYGLLDKVFIDGKKQSLDGNIWGYNWGTSVYFQYGITDRLMAEISLPYVNNKIFQSFTFEIPRDPQEQYIYTTNSEVVAKGIGDMDLTISYQLFTERERRPAIGLTVRTSLPTGEKDVTADTNGSESSFNNPTGQGEVSVNTAIRARKVSYPFAYGGGASYTIRTEVDKITELNTPEVSYKNGNTGNIFVFFNTSLNDWVVIRNFVDFFYSSKTKINDVKTGEAVWSLQYSPGFSFQLKRFRLDQFVSIPIKSNLGSADPNYILILQYTF